MSLTSLLLALLPVIVRPNLEPEKPAPARSRRSRERDLEREISRLLQINETAAGRIQTLEAERDAWRRRYEQSQDMLACVGAAQIDHRLNQLPYAHALAQQQQAQAQLAQYQMQQALNAQNYQAGLAQPFERCNCVPARHDLLLGGIAGGMGA